MSQQPLRKRSSEQANRSRNKPEQQDPLVKTLCDHKRKLEKIADQIRPDGPLQDIEEDDVEKFLRILSQALVVVDGVPADTKLLQPKDGVYDCVFEAKVELLASLQSLKNLNMLSDKYNTDTYKQHIRCLRQAYIFLKSAIAKFTGCE